MDPAAAQQLEKLLDLDARHDHLLRQLEELDRKVEQTLRQFLPSTSGPDATCAVTAGDPGAPTC